MDRLYLCLIGLIDEINHAHCVVLLDEEDVGGRSWSNLHLEADGIELDAFDDLVEFKVANEQVVALSDVADVAC